MTGRCSITNWPSPVFRLLFFLFFSIVVVPHGVDLEKGREKIKPGEYWRMRVISIHMREQALDGKGEGTVYIYGAWFYAACDFESTPRYGTLNPK